MNPIMAQALRVFAATCAVSIARWIQESAAETAYQSIQKHGFKDGLKYAICLSLGKRRHAKQRARHRANFGNKQGKSGIYVVK